MNELFNNVGAVDAKRDEWLVLYSAAKLAEAALAKKSFHTERLAWWKNKKEEVMGEIQSSGVEVNESIVDELAKSGYNTISAANFRGQDGPTVSIRPELVAKMGEAHSKVQAHQTKVSEYDGWYQMLNDQTSAMFNLNISDWLYFFGK